MQSTTTISGGEILDERKSVFKGVSDMAGMINRNKNLTAYNKEELFKEFLIIGVNSEKEISDS